MSVLRLLFINVPFQSNVFKSLQNNNFYAKSILTKVLKQLKNKNKQNFVAKIKLCEVVSIISILYS